LLRQTKPISWRLRLLTFKTNTAEFLPVLWPAFALAGYVSGGMQVVPRSAQGGWVLERLADADATMAMLAAARLPAPSERRRNGHTAAAAQCAIAADAMERAKYRRTEKRQVAMLLADLRRLER